MGAQISAFRRARPRIGFLQEALRWWDFWLKGEPTGVTRDPPFRVYVMDAEKPAKASRCVAGPLDCRSDLG